MKTIMSNCTNWISFSSKEIDYLKMLSELCGSVIDYNGKEKPLISPSEMQYLKKTISGVEVLILRQGVRPYVVTLPYFDRIEEFQITKLTANREIEFPKRGNKNEYKLDLTDWRKISLNKMQQETADRANESVLSDEYGIKSRIEAKFFETYGDVLDDY